MTQSPRLAGLDAVRAVAMVLGVAFHACWAYVPDIARWYVVQDASTSPVFAELAGALHAFRMEVFFALAGFFAHLGLERRGPRGFVVERAKRLLVPFAVALPLVLLADVGVRSLVPGNPFGAGVRWQPLHLWFLEALFVFCVVAAVGWPVLRRLTRPVEVLVRAPESLLVLAVPTMVGTWLTPELRPDVSFLPDGATLLHHGWFFVFGFTLWPLRDTLRERLSRAWWLLGPAVALTWFVFSGPRQYEPVGHALVGLIPWLVLPGVLSLALRLPDRERPALRFAVDGAYWVYLVHYPLVLLGHVLLATLPWPAGVKYVTLVSAVLLVAFGSFALFVRRSPLAPWLGVRASPLEGR